MNLSLPDQPPHSFEAENAVIAALLNNNDLYDKVGEFLHPSHFYDPLNQRIFKYIAELIEKGSLANKVTVWPMFMRDKTLIERGGEEYFSNLCQSVMSIAYIQDYGKQIFDSYLRREMIKILVESLANCYKFTPESSALKFIENTEADLFKLSKVIRSNSEICNFKDLLHEVLGVAKEAKKSGNKIIGIPSGFIDLDKHLGGLHKSDLIILAGRPSMGKTSLGTTMGFYAAKSCKIPVAFFSLEMSPEQLTMRILGQESMVSPDKIRRGTLTQEELDILEENEKRLANIPFFIIPSAGLTVAQVRHFSRKLLKEKVIGLIIIDYLQLLKGSGRSENRVQELSEITRDLKSLANELNIPILALSQLSRAVEQREDKRPQLADLRESGTIEQDADVVMFIFRESYYEQRKKPAEGSEKMRTWQDRMHKTHNIAELIIAKQRHGPIKNIILHYEESLAKFGNHIVNFYENNIKPEQTDLY